MEQIVKTKMCKESGQEFFLTDKDMEVFKMFNVPEPSISLDERHRRRTTFRNELNLYNRKCDATGRDIISLYSPDKPNPVYCPEYWWGDDWDPCDYGMDFDFSRSFFEQYAELMAKVPLLSSMVFKCTNCEYTNLTVDSKNCYLAARIGECEDVIYSYLALHSTGCVDCCNIYQAQYCYECVDCWSCYECFYCQLCKNSNNCYLSYDLIGCSDCFGCVGLRNKKLYFRIQRRFLWI